MNNFTQKRIFSRLLIFRLILPISAREKKGQNWERKNSTWYMSRRDKNISQERATFHLPIEAITFLGYSNNKTWQRKMQVLSRSKIAISCRTLPINKMVKLTVKKRTFGSMKKFSRAYFYFYTDYLSPLLWERHNQTVVCFSSLFEIIWNNTFYSQRLT